MLNRLLEMDDSRPLSMLTHRRTYRMRGPRPCSWLSTSSDSSLNEHQDIWPWLIARSLSRESTLRSATSAGSSNSTISSSSPVQTPDVLVEYSEKPYCRHVRRRKPAGPRAPRNSSCFDIRPGLSINTSLPAIPQFQREMSPTMPIQSAVIPQSSHMAPLTINSPTNFLLDWDVIFEILGCSEALADGTGNW